MKLDNTKIRASLDSRLSALEADPARRARIRRRIYEAEEPVMKRKFTASAVFAIALAIMLMGTAIAAGINLFAYFGKDDVRLSEIAPQAELTETAAREVHTEVLGETDIAIDSAYYDGQSLLVGYTIKNEQWVERFEPSAEHLAAMEKMETVVLPLNDGRDPILTAFYQAVERGEPSGFVDYAVYISDTWETADGIELPPSWGHEDVAEDGRRCMLLEFENPLPEAAQNCDSLNIRAEVWRSVNYTWFDGQNYYNLIEREQDGTITASVNRTEVQTVRYAGEGSYNGIPVHLSAEGSLVSASLTITADGDAFPRFEDNDIWYDVYMLDENGRSLFCTELQHLPNVLQTRHMGTGRLPEQLSVYILVCREGEGEIEEMMEDMEPIVLTPQN